MAPPATSARRRSSTRRGTPRRGREGPRGGDPRRRAARRSRSLVDRRARRTGRRAASARSRKTRRRSGPRGLDEGRAAIYRQRRRGLETEASEERRGALEVHEEERSSTANGNNWTARDAASVRANYDCPSRRTRAACTPGHTLRRERHCRAPPQGAVFPHDPTARDVRARVHQVGEQCARGAGPRAPSRASMFEDEQTDGAPSRTPS